MSGLVLCWLLAGALSAESSAVSSVPTAVPEAYRLSADATEVRRLYDCADFIVVGELESTNEPFSRVGGGGAAVQAGIYRVQSVAKGSLKAKRIPVLHLTDDSPYAQGDRRHGFELDRRVFKPGLKVLLFLRSRCHRPEKFRDQPNRTADEALRAGSLKLLKGYEVSFYTVSSDRGVYAWEPGLADRLDKAVRETPPQGKPNACCPYSRPNEYGPPCPPEAFGGE